MRSMRVVRDSILISLLTLAATAKAQVPKNVPGSSEPTAKSDGGFLSKSDAISDLLIRYAPSEKLSCSLKSMKEIIRPSAYQGDQVGGPNAGFVAYYKEILAKNPCFTQTAQDFWKEISEENKDADSKVPKALFSLTTPGLMERAGEGRFAAHKPGWLWERAMKATGGNPNIAMGLIGMCGHDYDLQDLSITLSPEKSKAQYEKMKKKHEESIAELRSKLATLESASLEWKMLDRQIKNTQRTLDNLQERIEAKTPMIAKFAECPSGRSVVFANQSLDSSIDLPNELKSAIAKVQRPNGTAATLPSKTYHYMAGANIGCLLAKCGVSPETAGQLAGKAAEMYRALRLCPHIKTQLMSRDEITKELDISENDPRFREKALDYLRKKRNASWLPMQVGPTAEEDTPSSSSGRKSPKKKPVQPAMGFGMLPPSEGSEKMKALNDRLIVNQLDSIDAAILYGKWYLGGPDGLLPCTSIRQGPADLNVPDITKDRAPHQPPRPYNTCGIAGWSVERCENARFKLSSWDIDFTWTSKQQEIGAKFGASKCRPDSAGNNFDQRLCPNGFDGELNPLEDPRFGTKFLKKKKKPTVID